MKKILLLFFVLTFGISTAYAQTDYSSTSGLYGTDLQIALHKLIKNHTKYPYTSSSTDTWDILKEADKDPNNPENILTIYIGASINAAAEYDNGAGWNREHVWAKSHGFPDESDTAYTDCHHLHAADISTNSARSDKDFGNGGNEYYDGGTVPTGCYYTTISWEPRDEVKGDVARSMLYMATRYDSPALDLQLVESIPTETYTPYFGKLSTLLAWNRFDPPTDWERRRNNVVESFQHNRNPFIDHPEFADRIYITDSLIIEYAKMIGPNKFIIKFSENLSAQSSVIAENYSLLNSDLQITSATLNYNGDNSIVQLTVDNNLTDSVYIARVVNVQSEAGKKITKDAITVFVFDPTVDVNEETLPNKFELMQNYPNPFNPTTTIKYSIPVIAGVETLHATSLQIYNVLGQKVATLVNEKQAPGTYSVQFDASELPSGIYFYTLRAGNFAATKKMILLK